MLNNFKKHFPQHTIMPLLLIAIASVILLLSSLYFFNIIKENIYSENENTLSSLTVLKSDQISDYKTEQLKEVRFLSASKSFNQKILRYIENPNDTNHLSEVSDWLLLNYYSNDYHSVILLDNSNKLLFSYPHIDNRESFDISGSDSVRFLDFFIDPIHKTYKLGIYLPIMKKSAAGFTRAAAVVFFIDPDKLFYPLVEEFPFKTTSGEMILIRHEGDSIRYLSHLRFRKDSPLQFTLPLSRKELPAVQAVLGKTGFYEGIDYRNERVISYITKIKGTEWFLLAKIDYNEVFKNINLYTGLLFGVVIILFIAMGTTIYSVFLKQVRKENEFKIDSLNTIVRLNRIYNILSKSNRSMVKANSLEELFTNVVRIATEDGQYSLCTIGLYSEDLQAINLTAYSSETKDSPRGNLTVKVAYFPDEHPISHVAMVKTSIIYNTVPEVVTRINRRFSKDAATFNSIAAFPIVVDLRVTGIIAFGSKITNHFTQEEISLLEELVADLSYAMKHFETVTSEKATKGLLSEQDAIIDAVVNSTDSVVIFAINTSYRYLMFNKNHSNEMKKVYGADIQLGHSMLGYVTIPELVPIIKQLVDRTLNGEVFTDVQLQPNTGAYYEFHWNPVYKEKAIIGASCFIIDITERKLSERLIAESEEKYKLLFFSNPFPMWVYDRNTRRFLEVNEAAVNKYGYSIEEFLQMSIEDIRPKSELDRLLRDLEDDRPVFQNSGYWQHKLKSGKIITVEITSHLITYDDKDAVLVLANDRTAELNSEKELRKSEETLRLAMKAAHLGVFDFDIRSGQVRINDEYEIMLGYEPHSLSESYTRWAESLHPDDQPGVISFLNDYISGKIEDYRIIFRLKTKDENWKWILSTGKIIEYDEAGKPARMLGTHLDISRQKADQERLSIQSQILDQVSHAVCVISTDDTIIYTNAKLTELCLWNAGEILGKLAWDILVSPENSAFLRNTLQRIYADEEWRGEMQVYRKNDTGFISYSVLTPFKDENGVILGSIITIEDITAQKKQLQQIRNLSHAVEQSPVSILITDLSGNIIYANNRVSELTGYSQEELLGVNPKLFQSGKMPADLYKDLWETILAGKKWAGELLNKKKDGSLYWESASMSPIIDESGEIKYFLAVKEDITPRKEMIQELIDARNKAEESNRTKTNFLSNMSHELRTPLIAILGFSEMLIEQFADEDILRPAMGIQAGGNRLLKTVDSLMHFTNIVRKGIQTNAEVYNLSDILNPVLDRYRTHISEKGITLSVDIDNVNTLITDKQILSDAFEYIINNAYRFTFNGTITVSAQSTGSELQIRIKDTGIGIAPEKQEIIYEEFRQVSEGFGRAYEGTGLGLTLAKRYIEVLNGYISLVSTPGEGSEFIIHLPKHL